MRKSCHLPHGKVQTAAVRRVGSAENKDGSFIRGAWGDVEMQAETNIQQTMEETHVCRHTQS